MEHFADRLSAAIRTKGTCLSVGIDPRWADLPLAIRDRCSDHSLEGVAEAFEEFSKRVIDLVAPLVPVVKPQSAFFELAGPPGMAALQRILAYARKQSLITIMDGKRNDIASTAQAYADAAFGGLAISGRYLTVWDADAITVNPYLGREAVEPFLKSARGSACGIFILVRTSNPGAGQFQDLESGGEPLYVHVARAVRSWTCENLGACGFGDVGAVVGATRPKELAQIREVLPEAYLLLPGLGAQGATAKDTVPAFRSDGLGAIVNSARGITFCYDPSDPNWEEAIVRATRKAIADLAAVTPRISE
jgi:orotidine-5'-phosphate decarboxylase